MFPMPRTGIKRWMFLLAGLCLCQVSAHASLGGAAASVRLDQQQLHGRLVMQTVQGIQIARLTTPAGIEIREYIAAGKVFGLAWRGPWLPNLRQLLGPYFSLWQAQAKKLPPRRGPFLIETHGLTISIAGRPRSFTGMAYLRSDFPRSFQARQLGFHSPAGMAR